MLFFFGVILSFYTFFSSDIYGLLTKCEVKMAGYRPSSFFGVFMDRDESRDP